MKGSALDGATTKDMIGWKGIFQYRKWEDSQGNNQNKNTSGYVKNEGLLFERLITVEDLADAFGFAPQTVRNWVAMRRIPFIRIGGKTRFRKRSIEAWISQKENSCQ